MLVFLSYTVLCLHQSLGDRFSIYTLQIYDYLVRSSVQIADHPLPLFVFLAPEIVTLRDINKSKGTLVVVHVSLVHLTDTNNMELCLYPWQPHAKQLPPCETHCELFGFVN